MKIGIKTITLITVNFFSYNTNIECKYDIY